MASDSGDDLRTLLLSFRGSVTAKLDEHDRRFEGLEGRVGALEGRVVELTDEVRDRTRTMEMAILNAIRDLARDVDRRLTRLEG